VKKIQNTDDHERKSIQNPQRSLINLVRMGRILHTYSAISPHVKQNEDVNKKIAA